MRTSHIPVEPNPVTLDDLEAIFRVLTRTDGQPRDDGDIENWLLASRAGRWTRAEVAAATMTIAATFTGFRVMPGHMTDQIAAIRGRVRHLWRCPDPPRALREDPAAEIAWRRRAYADFVDRAFLALATGQPIDDVPLVLDTEPEPMCALPAAEQTRRVQEMSSRLTQGKAVPSSKAVPSGDDGWIPALRRVRARLDADTRIAVRAELDAARPKHDLGPKRDLDLGEEKPTP